MGESRSTGSVPLQSSAWRGLPRATRETTVLAALVDAASDALWAEDEAGTLLAWNAGAERLLGWTAGEIVGRSSSVLLPGDMDVLPVHPDGVVDTIRVRRDGTPVEVVLEAFPLTDTDGFRIGTTVRARPSARTLRGDRRTEDLVRRLDESLAEALDGDVILEALAGALVPALADACVVYLPRRDGRLRRLCPRHVDPQRRPLLDRLLALPEPEVHDEAGPGAVVRTGRVTLIERVTADMVEDLSGQKRAVLRALEPGAIALIPMRARGRTVGAVALLATQGGRELTLADIGAARRLADRAAVAVDNAQLFADARAELARRRLAEEALRERFEHLGVVYHMTEAVGRAADLEDIYQEALEGLRRGIDVHRAAISLLHDDGDMHFQAWHGITDAYRSVLEGRNPWAGDDRDPHPIIIPDIENATAEPADLVEATRREGIRALAFIPLVFRERLLGKFTLYFADPRILTNAELALATTIARTIAFAIVRVRDEGTVRTARDAAENANRAKSQFLGVMSHELRTPLNAVLGYSDLLLMGVRGPLTPGQREQVERIRASAYHQLELIDELLTYTRLQAGRGEPNLVTTDLRRVVADVAEFVRPEAEGKGLVLRVEVPDEPLELLTDPAWLRQIVLNLAANATKYTSAGEVAIGAARVTGGLVVRVRDTGPGIEPDRVEYIFEPFTQISEGRTRDSGGTGLGLSIARGLADLIGARIDVRTEPGSGSTFYVWLPETSRSGNGRIRERR